MFDYEVDYFQSSDAAGLALDCGDPVVVSGVSWAGAHFDAVVQPHPGELQRRRACGLGAITDVTTLDALSGLPIGIEVSWDALDPVVAAYLSGLDEGIVSPSPWGVRRLVEPPLEVACLLQRARHWREMGRIGILASSVPTALLLKHTPRDLDEALDRASRVGVGLYVSSRTSLRRLAAPACRYKLSTRRVRLIEVIYRKLLRQKAGTPAERSHPLSWGEAACTSPS